MAIDKKLIQGCLKNNRRSQNELYKELFSYLMNICMRYKLNYDDAGSALNAIFLKVLKGLSKLDVSRPFLPWVKTIAIRHLIDEYRQEGKMPNVSLDQSEVTDKNENEFTTAKLNADDILDMIKRLPTTTSKVFNLYVIDGYKHREIAKLLGIGVGTSKWHLNAARKQLQTILRTETKRLENINMEL